MHIRPSEKVFYTAYYSQLVGATITRIELVDDGEGGVWPTFTARSADGTERVLELSQDPEGNGPGFLFGLESP